jgi:prephenate dehydrogenase
MIVDVSQKILIVGLGLLGGSYAKVLRRFGFHISAITLVQKLHRAVFVTRTGIRIPACAP